MTAVLQGGKHGHEHFKFGESPTRIFVQTKKRGLLKSEVYQDTGQFDSGCRVYTYVRTAQRSPNGLVETEYIR